MFYISANDDLVSIAHGQDAHGNFDQIITGELVDLLAQYMELGTPEEIAEYKASCIRFPSNMAKTMKEIQAFGETDDTVKITKIS